MGCKCSNNFVGKQTKLSLIAPLFRCSTTWGMIWYCSFLSCTVRAQTSILKSSGGGRSALGESHLRSQLFDLRWEYLFLKVSHLISSVNSFQIDDQSSNWAVLPVRRPSIFLVSLRLLDSAVSHDILISFWYILIHLASFRSCFRNGPWMNCCPLLPYRGLSPQVQQVRMRISTERAGRALQSIWKKAGNGHGQIGFLHGQDWHLFSLRYVDMHRIQQGGAFKMHSPDRSMYRTMSINRQTCTYSHKPTRYLQKSRWFTIYLGKIKHVCHSFLSFVDFRLPQGWSQLVGNASFQADTVKRPFRCWDRPTTDEQKTSPQSSPRQFPISGLSYPAWSWEEAYLTEAATEED